MRVIILVAGASLALTACNKHDEGNAVQNSAGDLTAEKIVANDVTAIDAVTADAANMAADVNYEDLNAIDLNEADNGAAPATTHSAAKPAKPAKTPHRAAATRSAANATSNSD